MLIFSYALLLFLSTVLFKPKKGVLCCGLFGGSFNRPVDLEIIRKFKVLGLFNQSRGEHSCGVYNGNNLVKGVDGNKKFHDFAVNVGIEPNDGTNNILIGHTRYATMGAHNADNAHPFLIEDQLILAHNGKLENHWELCRNAGIPTNTLSVDSQALGHLILKTGHKALEKYKGFAAILLHRLKEPNVLYAYHGASRNYANGIVYEERPLFYMEAAEGVYFSSMRESLDFIREKGDSEPTTLPHNLVYRIRNGKFMTKSTTISREDMNVAPPYVYTAPAVVSPKTTTTTNSSVGNSTKAPSTQTNTTAYTATKVDGQDINRETVPLIAFGTTDRIYYHRNRYWLDGKLCEGLLVVDKNGTVITEAEHEPRIGFEIVKRMPFHFYKGVMLHGAKEYNTIMKSLTPSLDNLGRTLTMSSLNFAKAISKFSKYPVTNMDGESTTVEEYYRKMFYADGKEVLTKNSTTPLFSDRTYHYNNGRLIAIIKDKNKDTGGKPDEKFFLEGEYPRQSSVMGDTYKAFNGKGTSQTAAELARNRSGSYNGNSGGKHATRTSHLRSVSTGRSCVGNVNANYADALAEIKASFDKVFTSVADIEAEFTGDNYVALTLYMMDAIEKVQNLTEYEPTLVEEYVRDIYLMAVRNECTIDETLERSVENIDFYIVEALKSSLTLEAEEDDDFDTEGVSREDAKLLTLQDQVDEAFEDEKKKKAEAQQTSLFKQERRMGLIVPLSSDSGFARLNNILNESVTDSYMEDDYELKVKIDMENTEASEILIDFTKNLDLLRGDLSNLNRLENSKFAEKACERSLYYMDQLKASLVEIANENKQHELAMSIKQSMSAHAETGVGL